jgi:hypothetical protein
LNATDIPNSKITIHNGNVTGQLQVGPDNKIYVAFNNRIKLGVINNPNELGIGCNFILDGVDLAGKKSKLGLPAFNQSFFFNPSIKLQNACANETVQFELNTNQAITSAIWDFGDGSLPQNSIIGSHSYSTPGPYTVSVFATSTNGTGTKTRDIIISAVPTATQPANMLPCDNDNNGFYNFDLTIQNATILNGQNASQYTVRYFANATDYANKIAIANPTSYANTVAYQAQTIIAEWLTMPIAIATPTLVL